MPRPKLKKVVMWMDEADWEDVKVLADEEGISAAEYVRRLMRRSLAQKRVPQEA